jgi:SAM-dependent methyltransferase
LRDADATYCPLAPSNQNLVDILKGTWLSAFPAEYGVQAGDVNNFDADPRVPWVANHLKGGLHDRSVLELGPYEAFNTWQLEKAGVGSIVAIEANDINFLKCLLVKEMTGLRARFLHGDFVAFLETCRERFDVVWASGVLYHSTDPLRLIELIANVADTVFIHTHYYVDAVINRSPHAASYFVPGRDRIERFGDRSATLHFRAYGQLKRRAFGGGPKRYAYWMEKPDIFAYLRHCGFDRVIVGHDHPNNPNGPALFCLAQRTGAPPVVVESAQA